MANIGRIVPVENSCAAGLNEAQASSTTVTAKPLSPAWRTADSTARFVATPQTAIERIPLPASMFASDVPMNGSTLPLITTGSVSRGARAETICAAGESTSIARSAG